MLLFLPLFPFLLVVVVVLAIQAVSAPLNVDASGTLVFWPGRTDRPGREREAGPQVTVVGNVPVVSSVL